MRLKRVAGAACDLVGAFLRYPPKHPVLRGDVTDEGYLAWVMPEAKVKPIALSETGRGRPILSDARASRSREQSKTQKGPVTTAGDTLLERQRNLTDRAPY